MKNKLKYLWFGLLCIWASFSVQATHIVGGALYYEKIAPETYVVTLKMYRDCKPGTVALPTTALIEVRGDQGSQICPSKDFNLPRISLTQLDPVVDTCVIESSICVQEGIYQDTIFGFSEYQGYHLYHQNCCRNSSVVNVVNPLNAGESFYAYIPPEVYYKPETTIWFEDFYFSDGVNVDIGSTPWSSNYTAPPGYHQVENCRFEASHTNPSGTWISGLIDISAYPSGVSLRTTLFSSGISLENTDSLLIYYSLNGGADVLFPVNGTWGGAVPNGTIASTGALFGTNIRIKIRTISNSNDEYYAFDNVGVYTPPPDSIYVGDNSNPVFVNFPPIFVCASETLLFDHSASDLDGDSLSYSLYHPFDGRQSYMSDYTSFIPTFNNNDSILFDPIPYSGSYTYNNPMGPGTLALDPITGMLTINPSTLGQFVVGVMVKEWRNGVMIGYSVRDFQFNVIYCPPVADAIINYNTNCDNTIYTATSQMSASSYYWNFGVSGTLADTARTQSVSYSFPDTGTYIITLITNVGTPCADTTKDTIRIKWITPNFSFSSVHCTDDPIQFTDLTTHSNNTDITQWHWDFDNGTSSNLQNPLYTYTVAGSYDVTLTASDGTGCSETITQNLVVNPDPDVILSSDFTHCDNLSPITLAPDTENVNSIQWITNGSGSFIDDQAFVADYQLGIGDTFPHTLSITAIVGGNAACLNDTDTVLITLLQAPELLSDSDQTICFGENGDTITASASGGILPYTYTWSNGFTGSSQFVDTGTYTVQITDAQGCQTAIDTILVRELNIQISVNVLHDSVVCDYNLPKEVFAVLTGATGVQWSGLGSFTPTDTSVNTSYTPSLTELSSGQFTIYAQSTGNGGCPADYDTATIYISDLSYLKDSVIPGCDLYNGQASVLLSGGFPPYSYAWSSNASGQTSATATGLFTGIYHVTATDFYGCQVMDSFNLNNNQPILNITSITHVVCYGDSTGSATVQASNGVPGLAGYIYAWDSLSGYQIGASATNLAAGTYQVSVTDSINCTATIPVTILQPTDSALPSIVSQTNLLCFGDSNGMVTLTTTGGTGTNYTYLWSTNPVQTDSVATQLSAGTYIITVYDDSLCPSLFQVTITQPSPLQASTNVISDYHGQDISCHGASDGTAFVSATGGAGTYQYQWDDPLLQINDTAQNLSEGIYHVTITDSNLCQVDTLIALTDPDSIVSTAQVLSDYNGQDIRCFGDSNGIVQVQVSGGTPSYSYQWNDPNLQTTSFALLLPAGLYQVNIRDINGCLDSTTIQVTQPPLLQLNLSTQPTNCHGDSSGAVTVSPIGGNPPFQYNWDVNANNQITATATQLAADTYHVVVADTNGCYQDTFAIITQPNALLVTAIEDDTICPGNPKVLTVSANGGGGNYLFHWNTGALGASLTVVPTTTKDYMVYATDANNCISDTDTVTVFVRKFVIDSLQLSGTHICYGESTQIEAFYAGNLGPYIYSWSSGQTGPGPHTVSPLDTTVYTVSVSDACFNTISNSIVILVYPLPLISGLNAPFSGCQPLEISIADSLFQTNIAEYIWNMGDGTILNGNPAEHIYTNDGIYQVLLSLISDKGCTAVFDTTQTVQVFPKPDVICNADPTETDTKDPKINFTSSVHSTYMWDFGVSYTLSDTSSTSPTSYNYPDTGIFIATLIVHNEFGCSDTCEQEIIINPEIKIQVPNVFIPNSNGSNGGSYNASNLTNDVFTPLIKYLQEYHMMVFNRWGEMVFETHDINIGWDGYYKGELCQQDVYAWKIKATFTDGKTRDFKGDITLLR